MVMKPRAFSVSYKKMLKARVFVTSDTWEMIRTGPGFAFVTNLISVSNTSSIEIILLSRTS